MYLPVLTALPFLSLVGFFISCAPQQVLGAPVAGTEVEARQVTFPRPLPDPSQPAGDGAGTYNSIKPTLGDRAKHASFRAMVVAADGLGLDNAARNMDHYLNNVGTTLTNYPENIMHDIPAFKEEVRALADKWGKQKFAEAKVGFLTTKTFVTPWSTFYATKELSADWFFALGGFSYSVAGFVQTQKINNVWTGQLAYVVYTFDRYNWDTGKGVTIGPFTFTDAELGRMHLVGLAKEYIVRGTSEPWYVKPYTGGNVPAPTLHPKDDEF